MSEQRDNLPRRTFSSFQLAHLHMFRIRRVRAPAPSHRVAHVTRYLLRFRARARNANYNAARISARPALSRRTWRSLSFCTASSANHKFYDFRLRQPPQSSDFSRLSQRFSPVCIPHTVVCFAWYTFASSFRSKWSLSRVEASNFIAISSDILRDLFYRFS